MTKVTVYTKPDCCLCDEALAVIDRVGRDVPLIVEKIDIGEDPALMNTYGERIPVVLVDGAEAFQYHVSERRLRRLAGAGAPS
jgi:thiol-disulfide isomerase/thioredoxin